MTTPTEEYFLSDHGPSETGTDTHAMPNPDRATPPHRVLYERASRYRVERLSAARTSPRPGKTPLSVHAKTMASELKARSTVAHVAIPYVHPRDIIAVVKRRWAVRKADAAHPAPGPADA